MTLEGSLSCSQEPVICPCLEPEESNPHYPKLSEPLLMLNQVSLYGICGRQRDIDRGFSLSSLSSLVFLCHDDSTSAP
jgi:hypothetical protein